ncbi:MAG TPA: dihydrofolate reductase family protein [Candidatus Limnocylindrales bacterium]|nr:dihydrofolate reductase family protein [Candidatus Limnocylindrales bacterium]
MPRLVVFDHVTLDGHFCGPAGDITFFGAGMKDSEFHTFAEENICAADALLFGRVTYDLMFSYWPKPDPIKNDPVVAGRLNNLPKFVSSRTLTSSPWNNTRILKGDLASEVRKLKNEGPGSRISILGSGSIVAQLAPLGLIDEFEIVIDPVAIGAGRALFDGLSQPVNLRLTNTRTFRNGNILLHYQPAP